MMNTETMCDRCNEAPAHSYNDDRCEALCESCQAFYAKHNCAGEHCYCIGGEDNYDSQNDYEPDDLFSDADALASAGFGTDEDYGCYDSGDF